MLNIQIINAYTQVRLDSPIQTLEEFVSIIIAKKYLFIIIVEMFPPLICCKENPRSKPPQRCLEQEHSPHPPSKKQIAGVGISPIAVTQIKSIQSPKLLNLSIFSFQSKPERFKMFWFSIQQFVSLRSLDIGVREDILLRGRNKFALKITICHKNKQFAPKPNFFSLMPTGPKTSCKSVLYS